MLPDDKRLREFKQRMKKQFNVDPTFIQVHPQDKTDGGVYEFEIPSGPEKVKRYYYWCFANNVGGGQLAMDVVDGDGQPADYIVNQWLLRRKTGDSLRVLKG